MRVVIVGAGISGLVAARSLVEAGADVRVVDRAVGPGGRLATRRIGTATVDHGAQFFTVRTPAFGRCVDDWVERGLARVWCHGFDSDDGHPRYVATNGMNTLAKDLARGLHIDCPAMAFAVGPAGDGGHRVVIDDGSELRADAVVVTTPLPQAFALLADADIELDLSLMRTEYDRTIALLATLDGPAAVDPPGGVQAPAPDVSFVADNLAKGVSAVPAITFHAAATWSEAHWDEPLDRLDRSLRILARSWIGEARIVESQVKKWRFATPRTIWPDPCWVSPDRRIVLAGDAFAGPRVEGAHNSGLAAAHALTA